ncbi:MAG: hypothetical protein U1E26_08320 [Coriobacteriia bacterium]|nr:hypothetical protein [Coriobacteriia bacterium]
MRPAFHKSPLRTAFAVLSVIALVCALALAGCQDIDQPNVVEVDGEVGAKAVEATLSAQSAPVGPWPEKVGSFAVNYGKGAWWPKELPEGYRVESVDVVEFEPKSGLVCDALFSNGDDDAVTFTQGSAVMRDYEVVSVGRVAWGTEQADVAHQDPSDTTTPKMIVFVDEGTLCELSGTDFGALEAMAASMVPVK